MITWNEPIAFQSKIDRRRHDSVIHHGEFELQVGVFEDERFPKERMRIDGFWGLEYGSSIYLEWIGPMRQAKLTWRFPLGSVGHDLTLSACETKIYQPIIDLISEQETNPVSLAILARLHELLRRANS